MVIFDVSGSVAQVERAKRATRVNYGDIAEQFVAKWSEQTKNADAKEGFQIDSGWIVLD